MRAFITALSIFLWLLLGWFLLQSNKDCCQDGSEGITAVEGDDSSGSTDDATADTKVPPSGGPSVTEDGSPLYLAFNWNNASPEISDEWEGYRSQLVDGMEEGQNLEITGLYDPDENNGTAFENLGLARANQIKDLLGSDLDEGKIQIAARSINDGSISESSPFEGVSFRTFLRKDNIDESIADRTIIRFQQNSTNRISDPEVEDYLDKLANRLKSSGEQLKITGHTDRLGPYDENMVLGLRRAQAIKSYLVAKGVDASKVITESKGEASPIADNSTREGREQNRRTELEIIK